MTERHAPNCVGYTLSSLGLAEDGFYPFSKIWDYLEETDDPQKACAVLATVEGVPRHIVPLSPAATNISHRPGEGAQVRPNDTYHQAVGFFGRPNYYGGEIHLFRRKSNENGTGSLFSS